MLDIKPRARIFIPEKLMINSWDDIAHYAKDLQERPLETLDAFQKFLDDRNELDAVLLEDGAWRYINMTCNTADKEIEERYQYFVEHIGPQSQELDNALNKRVADSAFAEQVPDSGFALALRGLKVALDIYRPENASLMTQEQQISAESVKLRGAMSVTLDGEELTMQQAGDRLYWLDRSKREEAWRAMSERRYQDHQAFSDIYARLVSVRDAIAKNAGCDHYRDYAFVSKLRYDYTPQDCFAFHEAVEHDIIPLIRDTQLKRKADMGLDTLRPWDNAVDSLGRAPLKTFENADDLIAKSKIMFARTDPLFRDTVETMHAMDRLDLASRKNKGPGGYMHPMCVSKIPFIFMNATHQMQDMVTFVHEIGHTIHEIQMAPLRLIAYTSYPMEVAELGSMTMELLTMDHWDVFFPDEQECIRAKREHLESIIGFFPWMAQVDLFQHEVYTKPDMTHEQRHETFDAIQKRFSIGVTDWSGFEPWLRTAWQRQGHIFEMPFYYLEYGMAQLGALQIWRNYKRDPQKALQQYKDAMALGYTKSIPEIYETAGARFDFSRETVKELMDFVRAELDALE